MTVRHVRSDEYEALASLTVAAYRAALGPEMDLRYAAELADVAGRAALVHVLVAIDVAGALEGGIVYIPGPGPMAWFEGTDEAGIRMLAVDPERQGRGVGARLVAACVDRAVAAGKRRLLLHTSLGMTVALRLYERAGFRRDPEGDEVLSGGLEILAYALDLGR